MQTHEIAYTEKNMRKIPYIKYVLLNMISNVPSSTQKALLCNVHCIDEV